MARTYASDNPFNDGRYASERYDELLAKSTKVSDVRARMQIFPELEAMLLEEAAIIPTLQTSDIYVQDDRVRRLSYGPVRDFSRGVVRQ